MNQPVAVVGTGVIGAAWAALFLSRGHDVRAHDPAPGARDRLFDAVETAWPALVELGAAVTPPLEHLQWSDDLARAVETAAFVQESGPEALVPKQQLIAAIDAATPADAVIASSSSGVRPSDLQATCRHHPERVLVGHPFHPAHVIPLVEVVGGAATAPLTIERTMSFYRSLGKRPVHVRQELPGHVVNRLQAALWREAYSLVQNGVVTVSEIDAAITNGPGLRWAVIGPFAGQHLSGGERGIAHTLEHLGPPMVAWWDDLGHPTWTKELVDLVVAQTEDELRETTAGDLASTRDRLVLDILSAKAAAAGLPS